MNPGDLDSIATETYRLAGLSMERAVTPLYLARELMAEIVEVDGLDAVVVLRGSSLLLRRGVNQRLRAWRVAKALAYRCLCARDLDTSDDAVCSLAAALRTPALAYRRVVEGTGPDFRELGAIFGLSESAAAMRYGETTGNQIVLYTEKAPRIRGFRRTLRHPRRVSLTDEPARSVQIFGL